MRDALGKCINGNGCQPGYVNTLSLSQGRAALARADELLNERDERANDARKGSHVDMELYWLSVGIRAVQTFPTFIGNNWVGVLLSLILLGPSIRTAVKKHFSEIQQLAWSGKFFYTGRVLMQTNWKTVVAIVGAFMIGNFLTVGYRDYANATEQNKGIGQELDGAKMKIATSGINCQLQTNEIRNERDSEKAKNQTLEKQNRDEQVLIAGCQSEALKGLMPEPRRVTPLILDSDVTTNEMNKRARWIVLVNKTLTPIRFNVECNNRLNDVQLATIPEGPIGFRSGRLNDRAWQFELITPAWGPTSPLLITTTWRGGIGNDLVCSFNPH